MADINDLKEARQVPCFSLGHAFRRVAKPYFKGGEQRYKYAMLFCRRCADQQEVIAEDRRRDS